MLFAAVESIAASHAVRELAKHMVKPNIKHAAAARHCLQYLLATAHIGITYEHGDAQRCDEKPKQGFIVRNGAIKMYIDASFAEDMITRKSVSGYASVKNRAVITHGVKGQTKSHRRPAMPSFEPCLNASVRLIGCIN